MICDTLVRYDFDEFMSYRTQTLEIPNNLKEYCINNNNLINIRSIFLTDLRNINTAVIDGCNPNEIIIKNVVREKLNKIDIKNYSKITDELETIEFVTKNMFKILANELIIRSISDNMAIKGISESLIYTHIIKRFIEKTDVFFIIIKELLMEYFDNFISSECTLDKNNQYLVDNYKGFMHFIGILYNKQIINEQFILNCINKTIDLIMNKESAEEIHNCLISFERLLTQLLLDKNLNESIMNALKNIRSIDINKLPRTTIIIYTNLLNKLNKNHFGN
jgi:hypothetical protein